MSVGQTFMERYLAELEYQQSLGDLTKDSIAKAERTARESQYTLPKDYKPGSTYRKTMDGWMSGIKGTIQNPDQYEMVTPGQPANAQQTQETPKEEGPATYTPEELDDLIDTELGESLGDDIPLPEPPKPTLMYYNPSLVESDPIKISPANERVMRGGSGAFKRSGSTGSLKINQSLNV